MTERSPYFSDIYDSWVMPLTQGGIALVDEDDLPLLEGRSWTLLEPGGRGKRQYAVAHTDYDTLYMHRVIMQPTKDQRVYFVVRGKDGVIDNRKQNLRVRGIAERHG